MAAAAAASIRALFLIFFAIHASSSSSAIPAVPKGQQQQVMSSTIRSICRSAPYPGPCFDSLKISISIGVTPSILTYFLHSLQTAISEATTLSSLLSPDATTTIVEKQRGALQDCRDLHQITVSSLAKSASLAGSNKDKLPLVRTHLSAALTNKNTCLAGLDGSSGTIKPTLIGSILSTYHHVSNSLSLLSRSARRRRRLSSQSRGFPSWVGPRERRLLQSDDDGEYDPASILTVAADGSGNFTTIGDAIAFAPNNSDDRTIVFVRAGLYVENVNVPAFKTNIVLLGDGSDVTIIRGNRGNVDGWTTFRSATVAVSGQGFLARDIGFENVAGAAKGQAVALRVNADQVAIFRCSMDGYQDTLYVHSFRQFYRECDVYGTVDFVFGNAAVVFQGCNFVAKNPLPGQFNVVTAQSKDEPDEVTGISIQNCSLLAADDLRASTRTYLGRPWRNFSTTVYMQSYIGGHVDPAGWKEWSGDQGLGTLYYGEYSNSGPGSGTDGRVTWPGFHVMSYDDASNFTVSQFIYGNEWLDSTSFPYDAWI